jgi:hypothetical protein
VENDERQVDHDGESPVKLAPENVRSERIGSGLSRTLSKGDPSAAWHISATFLVQSFGSQNERNIIN